MFSAFPDRADHDSVKQLAHGVWRCLDFGRPQRFCDNHVSEQLVGY
jgi:hypothetical protein